MPNFMRASTILSASRTGWRATPIAAPGLEVNAVAADLGHPSWIEVLPNGDVPIAQSINQDRPPRSAFDYAMISTQTRTFYVGSSFRLVMRISACEKYRT